MADEDKLPPVPHQASVIDSRGLLTPVWAGWFRQLFARVGGFAGATAESVAADLDSHLSDTVDAHDASAISNSPSGNLAATNLQAAVNELQTDVDTRALASDLTALDTRVTSAEADIAAAETDIAGKQPLDSDLTALAALSTTGLVARTGDGTAATRTITGTTNEITVSNGDGASANPTLGLADDAVLPGTGAVTVPIGTEAQRPGTPVNGMVRYNSDSTAFEGYANGAWGALGSSASAIACRYTTVAGQSIATSTETIINFEDVDYDEGSLVTTGASWAWTASRAGVASVNARVRFSVAFSAGDILQLSIYLNGTRVSLYGQEIEASGTLTKAISISDKIKVALNDVIDIRVTQTNASSRALSTTAGGGCAVAIKLE